jgi:hypothetical protein
MSIAGIIAAIGESDSAKTAGINATVSTNDTTPRKIRIKTLVQRQTRKMGQQLRTEFDLLS